MKCRFVLLKIMGVVSLSLLLLSCGQSGRSPSRGYPHPFQYDFLNPQEAKSQYDSWEVKCLNTLRCPESVGQLIVLEGSRISICTATLISDDEVLTNSHCFDLRDASDNLISPEKICEGGASIVFASNSSAGRNQVRCKKVMKKSAISAAGFAPDYMILKLERKLNRKFDPISRAGMQDRQKLLIRVINPKSRGLGELEVKECEVLHRTSVLPAANQPDFYLQVLKGCDTIHGNSGSSLVDENGQVRGLFFAGVIQKDTSLMSNYDRKLFYKALEIKASLATNSTCIDYPFAGQNPVDLKKCAEDRTRVGEVKSFMDQTEFQLKLEAQALKQLADLPVELGYKLYPQSEQLRGFFAPSCVKKFKPLSSRQQSFRESSILAPVFIWTADYEFNDRLRPIFSFTTEVQNCHIRWSIRELMNRGQTSVIMTGSFCFDSRGNQGARKDTWPSCDP